MNIQRVKEYTFVNLDLCGVIQYVPGVEGGSESMLELRDRDFVLARFDGKDAEQAWAYLLDTGTLDWASYALQATNETETAHK